MGLETADTIYELNEANPDGSQDTRAEGDDHLRLIKDAIKKTFLRGLEANRPAAGVADRLYTATDTKKIFRDNGASWDQLGPDPEPPGIISPYAAAGAPAGYLICAGQAVSRTTFDALFDVIGTTYGDGDGSTTFNVPDLRGRVVLCRDNLSGTSADRVTDAQADQLGGSGGAEDHTLTINEMPAHDHAGSTTSDGVHVHGASLVNDLAESTGAVDALGKSAGGAGQSAGAHTHSLSINNRGGDQAHNNMQPFLTLSYIIKT